MRLVIISNYQDKLLKKYNITTSGDLAKVLLEEARVGVLPGTDFFLSDEVLTCRFACVDFDGKRVLEKYRSGEKLDITFVEKFCYSTVQGLNSLEHFLKSL